MGPFRSQWLDFNCLCWTMHKLMPYMVCKPKILVLLQYLWAHDILCAGLPPPDVHILDMYPDNGIFTWSYRAYCLQSWKWSWKDVWRRNFSFDQHPAELSDTSSAFFKQSGIYVPGHNLASSVLHNIAIASNTNSNIHIWYRQAAISEYNNPALFPGMFPTLFPWHWTFWRT